MNRTSLTVCLWALITFAISGCSKDNSRILTSIQGTWELRQTAADGPPIIYTEGNGNILTFTGSSYEMYASGQLVKSGTYTIEKDMTVEESVCLVLPDDEFRNRIVYDNNYDTTKQFIEVSENKLSLISGCFALDWGHRKDYERR